MSHRDEHAWISNEFLGGGHRLGGIALVIQRVQHQAIARENRSLRVGVLNGEDRPVAHILPVRRLVAGQWCDETNLHNMFTRAASCSTKH